LSLHYTRIEVWGLDVKILSFERDVDPRGPNNRGTFGVPSCG
jgi:hypothetical protein